MMVAGSERTRPTEEFETTGQGKGTRPAGDFESTRAAGELGFTATPEARRAGPFGPAEPSTAVSSRPAPAVAPQDTPAPAPAAIAPREIANLITQARLAVQSARQQVTELEQNVKALDASIAVAVAARDTASTSTPDGQDGVDQQTRAALERAQVAYNQAVARERRASALEAHGIAASQELEEAQMAVRAAAAEVANLRRAIDAAHALANAQVIQTRAQADAAIAEQQRTRQARADDLVQARLRLRQAEAVLAAATREQANMPATADPPRSR